MSQPVRPYEPMTLTRLAELMATAGDGLRWRYIAEFLEEFGWEPPLLRLRLLEEAPSSVGDERWDAFVASPAE